MFDEEQPLVALSSDEQREKITKSCYRLLTRREYSRAELLFRFVHKGFKRNIINEILDSLEAQNHLSDKRFTESWIHYRRELGFGPLRIQQELAAKGISKELIANLLNPHAPEWLEALRILYAKKFPKNEKKSEAGKPLTPLQIQKQKQALYLRGFSADQIAKIFSLVELE